MIFKFFVEYYKIRNVKKEKMHYKIFTKLSNTFKAYFKGGGGCGRFWNLSILEICSLHKRLSRISFCMVRDKCILLIIPKRIFCLIFKIAAKSPKTAKFPAHNHSNVFLNSNCYKINFKIFIK